MDGITDSMDMSLSKPLELVMDMEQQTGSKLGKWYVKAVYCHPAYLTYMPLIVLIEGRGDGDDRGYDGCMASLTRWT